MNLQILFHHPSNFDISMYTYTHVIHQIMKVVCTLNVHII